MRGNEAGGRVTNALHALSSEQHGLTSSSLEIEMTLREGREDFELRFDLGVLDSLFYLSSTSESVS